MQVTVTSATRVTWLALGRGRPIGGEEGMKEGREGSCEGRQQGHIRGGRMKGKGTSRLA